MSVTGCVLIGSVIGRERIQGRLCRDVGIDHIHMEIRETINGCAGNEMRRGVRTLFPLPLRVRFGSGEH